MVEMETERLRLRAFRGDDFEDYARFMGDAETMRFIFGEPLDREKAWRSLAGVLGHWQLRGFGLWALEEKGTGALVGRAGLIQPEGWPGLEAGWLIDRRRWGEGFATEAARKALDFAFESLRAEHIISLIHPKNKASIRVAEKIGESFEGRTALHGKEVAVYGVSSGEYRRRRAFTSTAEP